MACYTPLKAYRAPGGRVVFSSKEGYSDRPFEIACGQCQGCRLERSRQWAIRCVHEAQLHERNCFVTLTYSPEHCPDSGSLDKRAWQLFAKRLRKRFGPVRYLHCGEYGDENFRPHYHACLFGVDFASDRQPLKSGRDYTLYYSETLDKLWGLGHCSVGNLTFESAAYVARYVMKKYNGDKAKEEYRRIDLETGEEYFVTPPYVTMSRRPGLGAKWFERFGGDVFPDDFVVHGGKKFRPPKFYDTLLERDNPEELERIKKRRRKAALARSEDVSPERLRVRELVSEARLSQLRRDL